jgi:hypothetical protein
MTIREILEVAENEAAKVSEAAASMKPTKPLTLRRRIFNWFERG